MGTNLNFVIGSSIVGLIAHIFLVSGYFAHAQTEQEQNTCLLVKNEEGFLALQLALFKESELSYMAETILKEQGGNAPLVMIEYVVNQNGAKFNRVEYRRKNEKSSPIGTILITNQHGNWRCTKEGIIKDCIDCIVNDLFYVKIFENFEPCSGEFRLLNKDSVNDEYILVERIISNKDSLMKIREKILNHSSALLTQLSDAGIRHMSDTDDHDIVPVRAIYKISKRLGIIIEDAYFNKNGERLDSTRQFDKVTILNNIPMSAFELPKGLPFYFPKTTMDNMKIVTSL